MKTLAAFATLVLLAAPAVADRPTGEEKLARMLEGRVAGESSRCINSLASRMQVIDGTALVFRQGRTLWVNRTADPHSLDSDDILVVRKFGSASQLCRLDSVTTRDRTGGYFSGVVFLEDFVPYRRAES